MMLMLLRRIVLRLGRNYRSFRTRAIVALVVLNFIFIYCLYRSSSSSRVVLTTKPLSTDLIVSTSFAPSAVKDSRTPLLDRLDTFRMRRDIGVSGTGRLERRRNVNVSGTGQLERCEGWSAGVPDVNMEEPRRWQIVDTGAQDTFVFSAYFDSR